MGLAVLAVGVMLYLALRSLRLRRRGEPARREVMRTIRDQETLNLARRMWMSGGE
jgi:hypothetical protein